jgi:hypothetical protein
MKPRLSNKDYCILSQMLITSRELQSDMFQLVNGKFPKYSKTMRKLLKLENAISDLYFQLEDEFFRDYPEEVQDYGE